MAKHSDAYSFTHLGSQTSAGCYFFRPISVGLASALALATAKRTPRDLGPARRDTTKTLVSPAEYANLVYYAQFPMSGQDACAVPPSGIVEQQYFNITETDTQAGIFRIDSRQEFVLAIPGTNGLRDYITDAHFFLTTYESPGNSLVAPVIDGLESALAQYPDYKVTISGHSMGGGIGELALGSLKPQSSLNISAIYTYGAPRTGNQQFADYIDSLSGASDSSVGIYRRVTHYNGYFLILCVLDPIPALPPDFLGYVHPRTEYWESADLSSLATTYQCYGQEPSDCINSVIPALNLDAHSDFAGMKDFC